MALPDLPPPVAVIVVDPSLTPDARPDDLLIVATEVLLLVQVNVTPGTTALPDVKAAAVNRCVSPSSIDGEVGSTRTTATTGGGVVTVSGAVPVTPSACALIVVVPGFTPLAKPEEPLIVATLVLLLVQENVTPETTEPFDVRAVAVNRCVLPTFTDDVGGLTEILAIVGGGGSVTVSDADPVRSPALALIVAVPALTPVAQPVEVTATTDGSLLDQLNDTFVITTSYEVDAVARNRRVDPLSMVADGGLTVTHWRSPVPRLTWPYLPCHRPVR